jgi:hypothetical protein
MKLLLRYFLLAICFCLLSIEASAQLRRKTREHKEFYDSGAIKKVTRTKTVQSIYMKAAR